MTFEELGEIEGLEDLKGYINSGYPLSNAGLAEYMRKNPSVFLDKVMVWNKLSDSFFSEGTKELKPFEGVTKALNIMHTVSDIMVVSAASSKGIAEKSISVLKEKHLPLKPNDGQKITVISAEPQKIAAAMDEKQCVDMPEKEIRAIHKNTDGIVVKLDPDADDIQAAVALAQNSDVIVLGMCSAIIFTKQVKLYEALKALGKPVIVVAMESPYDVELIPDCENYIATYGAARDWMKVAVMRMSGQTDINAKPAVTIE